MGCFDGCFWAIRKSCSRFRASIGRKMTKGKVAPAGENDVATSDPRKESSKPTAASGMTAEEHGASDREVTTPEALNQVVDEFIGYEVQKILALGQIQDDNLADELIHANATLDEISQAVCKEKLNAMPRVEC